MPAQTDWLEELKRLICKIYQEWGGDCTRLPLPIAEQITSLESMYAELGVPTFPDDAAEAAYLSLLESTEVHLGLSGNTLTQDENTRLQDLIDSLQSDIAGSGE